MKAKCKLIINNHTEQTKRKRTQQHGKYCTITKTTRANIRRSSRRFMSSCLNHRLLVKHVLCLVYVDFILISINPLNDELNPICYLPALLGAHHFFYVSWIRVKTRSSASFRISFRFCSLTWSTAGCSRAGFTYGCSHTPTQRHTWLVQYRILQHFKPNNNLNYI
jgi:hypothetical protein